MATGVKFAVIIDFRQVFWSILGQITYFFPGFCSASVRKTIVKAIPVAIGRSKTSLTN